MLPADFFFFKEHADQSGDNCIQNFHLERYIVGYAVANLVLLYLVLL